MALILKASNADHATVDPYPPESNFALLPTGAAAALFFCALRGDPRFADRTALAFSLRSSPGRFFVGTIRRRWHESGMNPTDPAVDPMDVRKLTPEMVKLLPDDPALLQRIVVDLRALVHEQRQEMQQLKQVRNLLEGLLPPSGPAVPRKKKRRQH
jgi:hypothetical protein